MYFRRKTSAGRAYLLKERVAGADELAQAIRTVAQAGSMIDPLVVDELIEARSTRRACWTRSRLTAR